MPAVHVARSKESIMHKLSIQQPEGSLHHDTTFARVKHWMYRGQRPNWIARVANRAWAIVAAWGIAPHDIVTLEVAGRKSGRIISLPVVLVVVGGERHLVSMLGDNSQWVHNVR